MTLVPPPVSVRLDAETEQRLRRLAFETGCTLSSVVREAVAEYGAAHDQKSAAGSRPFDRLRHLIGIVSAKPDRSERTGAGFRSHLKRKGRARRPR